MTLLIRFIPASATGDARILLITRGVRAYVDGIAYVVLPAFLLALGFNSFKVGAVVTASLLGSAVLTLLTGMWAHRFPPVQLLRAASWIMIATGIAFGLSTGFVLLLTLAAIGTMNPSAGDVSPFLPLEQSLLSSSVTDADRTKMFATYNLVGSLIGSLGALCSGLPIVIATWLDASEQTGRRASFILYGLTGVFELFAYQRLRPAPHVKSTRVAAGLTESHAIVYKLAALFSLDSFGGGFAGQAIFALWVYNKYDLSTQTLGVVFFVVGLISAFSSLLAVRVAASIGLVRTMVFTHIPASVLLILVALSPNVWLAMSFFIARSLLSQMDVPVRTSYVMAVVSPAERAAAASITNVPRSLASALPPLAAGWMLDQTNFAWPLLICATVKITYDLLLLWMFRDVRPPEERA